MAEELRPHLRVERVLRDDGLQSIVCATDLRVDELVTVKRILTATPEEAGALATEYAILHGTEHPNLTKVLEFGADEHGFWLLREYVEGETLTEGGPRLDPDDRRRVLIGILRALCHLHRLSVLHLDIKPDNILLRRVDGRVEAVLTDFGLSVEAGGDEGSVSARGTPPFIAPEVLLGLPLDGRADLFSLGVTWIAAAPNAPRFDLERIYSRFPRAGFISAAGLDLDAIDPEYAPLLERLLASAPSDRPSGALEVLRLLGDEGMSRDDWSRLLRPLSAFVDAPEFSPVLELVRGAGERVALRVVASCLADVRDAVERATFEAERAGVRVVPFEALIESMTPAAASRSVDLGSTRGAWRVDSLLAHMEGALASGGRLIVALADELDVEVQKLLPVAVRALADRSSADRARMLVVSTDADSELGDACGEVKLPPLSADRLAEHLARLEGRREPPAARQLELAEALLAVAGPDPEAITWVLNQELQSGRIRPSGTGLDLSSVEIARLAPPPGLTEELAALEPAPVRVLAALELAGGTWSRPAAARVLDPEERAAASALVARGVIEANDRDVRAARGGLPAAALRSLDEASRRALAERALDDGAVDAPLARARLLALLGRYGEAADVIQDAPEVLPAVRGSTVEQVLAEVAELCRPNRESWIRVLDRLGRQQLAGGKLDEARATYQELLAVEGASPDERAVFLARAGSASLLSGSYREALESFGAARKLASRANSQTDEGMKFAIDRGIAFSRLQLGDVDAALRSLEAVLRRRATVGDEIGRRLRIMVGAFGVRAGRVARTEQLLDEVVKESRQCGDDEALAVAQTNRATLLMREGRYAEARRALTEALQLRRQRHERWEEALALNNLGIALREMGELDEAVKVLAESLRLRRVMDDAAGVASVLGNLGLVDHLRGDLTRSIASYEESIATFERVGAVVEAALVRAWRAAVELHAGQLDRAEAQLRDLPVVDRVPRVAAEVALSRALVARARGDETAASKQLEDSLRLFQKAGDRGGVARVQLAQADLRLAASDPAGARRLLREAATAASPRLEPEVELRQALAAIDHGAVEEGLPLLLRVRDEARRMGLQRVRALAILELIQRLDAVAPARAAVLVPEARLAVLALCLPGLSESASAQQRAERTFGKGLAVDLDRTGREVDMDAKLRGNDDDRVTSEGIPDEIFRTFVAINRNILKERDLDRLLERVLDHAVSLSGARRGFIVLLRDGQVVLEYRSGDLDPSHDEISRTIVYDAIREKRPLVTANARTDQRLSGSRSIENFDLRSILCVPFDTGSGTDGAIYVDNPIREGVFTARSVDLLEALAGQAAIVIGNLERAAKIEQLNDELAHRAPSSSRAAAGQSSAVGEKEPVDVVVESEAMKAVVTLAERVATSDLPVLILGESGAGKEVLARLIHRSSDRADGPFIAENCSAIPETLLESEFFGYAKGAFTGADSDREGLFQHASGGTLFLDEIGDMPPSLQAKLLRVLQEGSIRPVGSIDVIPVDIRLVCATNRDLEAMVREGKFREDLYYRVRGATLRIPPLRERRDDIAPLSKLFLDKLNRRHETDKRFSDDALSTMRRHRWRGNVRELESETTRLYHLSVGDVIEVDRLEGASDGDNDAEAVASAAPEGAVIQVKPIQEIERDAILLALRETGGNREEAARRLKISRAAFYVKLKKYELSEEAPPSRRRKNGS